MLQKIITKYQKVFLFAFHANDKLELVITNEMNIYEHKYYFVFAASILLTLVIGCGSSKESTRKKYSDSFDYSELTPIQKKIVIESRKWLGVRYRYNGYDRKGVDCSGFVGNVFSANGYKLPRTSTEMFSFGKSVSKKDLQPTDLVFFKNTSGYGITHVGIYLGNFWFIHASTSRGVIESRLNEDYYQRHYAGARRILN